ncbi:MAG: AraC family transcriptional regulator [Oscillospiraceae bacterium]|nr:AraC family transcriptional regulator [Oscillospiraceae bacterium]
MQRIVQTVYYSKEKILKKSHFHDCHQIVLIVKGQVNICVNGNNLYAKNGDVAIFSRYENHSIQIQSEEYERYVLHIDPAVVSRKSPVYSLLTDRPSGFCNVINVSECIEEIADLFRRLIREHASSHALADEMKQLLFKQLLITIYRCTTLQFDQMHDDMVVDLKWQFENRYPEPFSLERLAKQYNISVSALSHRFHSATGISVMEYLQSCRMANAKQMLAETDFSIGQIVECCGFSDNSNFSRTFKKRNGISPSEFREKYKTD